MAMTKKDYEMVAQVLSNARTDVRQSDSLDEAERWAALDTLIDLTNALAGAFRSSNDAFDPDRFKAASRGRA